MAHAKTLQDKLAHSLDQANVREAAAVKKTEAALDAARRDYLAKARPLQERLGKAPAAAVAKPQGGGCTKLSVSLFPGDVERLEAIRAYMQTRGVRISTSQAVKLALRCAPLTDALAQALDSIRAEDGRKW
jgi:hypothetical protein